MRPAVIPTKKLQFLQALRSVAVILTVLNHFPGNFTFARTGYVGVDLFFVISGFIMVLTTSGLHGGPKDAAAFAVKRLCRIWPAYLVTSIVMALAFCLVLGDSPSQTLHDLVLGISFYPLWLDEAVNVPGWTLNFEMYFYAALAVSLLFYRARWWVLAGIIAFGQIGLPWLMLGKIQPLGPDYGFSPYGGYAYLALVSNKIVWCFLFGVASGLIYKSRLSLQNGFVAVALAIPGTAASLYMMYVIGNALDHGPWYGLSFALVILPLALRDKAKAWTIPRPITYVGDISYSIYVSHWLVARFFHEWSTPATYHGRTRVLVMFAIFSCLIAVVSLLTHYFLETRLSDWMRRKILQPKALPTIALRSGYERGA